MLLWTLLLLTLTRRKFKKRLVYISYQSNEDDMQEGVYAVKTQQMLFKYFLIL